MTARAPDRLTAALALLGLWAQGACGASSRTLACGPAVDPACVTVSDCLIRWDDPRRDATFCTRSPAAPPLRADCGGYHVVTTAQADAFQSYYFDIPTGQLVAIVTASSASNATTCVAGPAGGFTLPTCAGALSEPLAPCSDGGIDG